MCVTPNPHARALNIATIGDTDRLDTFEVVVAAWDSNGTLHVTIKSTDEKVLSLDDLEDRDIERARRLARRCLMHPEKTRSAAMRYSQLVEKSLQMTFAVSRNN